MTEQQLVTVDGNEAVAYVAYRTNEVCAIYPITPSSTMAEWADQWASEGKTNIWGNIPLIAEMQSEGGAAGAVHGALQTGALTTTYTASQGLLLMIPNMYKIAGELTSTVFHVAARSLAAQGLSIFGDHSDVMAVRDTGFAQLGSSSVQEAHDMALIAQAATLEARIPFIHFFDGFRTSHEVNKIALLDDHQIRAMIDPIKVREHRARGLNPDNPFIRGTAQNPDVYFQARETVNPFYQQTPTIVQKTMDKFAELTGRHYQLFEYTGAEDAERIIVIMGSAAETVKQTVKALVALGEKVGVIHVRLYLPFDEKAFLAVVPGTTLKIAVLDRCKTPGSTGEPLLHDVINTLTEAFTTDELANLPRTIGGRYGLSSKEFTPAMVKGIFDELSKDKPKHRFTIGINDDVGHTSLDYDPGFNIDPDNVISALFYGLGADGTVGANKNTIKIIGDIPDFFAQGYFVYDSKKSGSQTVSHLRFGPDPIHAPYLVQSAQFIGCHQFNFLFKTDILAKAAEGSVFLLNCPFPAEEVWNHLPRYVQDKIIGKNLSFYVIDATTVARESGMGSRVNTILQTCFFALSGVLPRAEAIAKIKEAIKKTYSRKGEEIVLKNYAAVDQTLAHLYQVTVPETATSTLAMPPIIPIEAPEFVQNVTAKMIAGLGDDLAVSEMPIDGTYPSGTTAWEKRNVSDFVPEWKPDLCIQCGNCSFVCPHSVIRAKFYHQSALDSAPASFKSAPISARGFPETRYTLQIYLEDCTGCNLCVSVCPALSLKESGVKAINMKDKEPLMVSEKENIRFFETLPVNDRARVDFSSIRGAQFLEPLFEFSGACAGCGETPYVKLISQLFGDRLIVANATGCSSIYGGNLPTTPWTKNHEGRGPAWSNSLFEDNAEFGFGFRLTADKHHDLAVQLTRQFEAELGSGFIRDITNARQKTESEIRIQRERVAELKAVLLHLDTEPARDLLSVADHLVRRSIWIVGGDGWAYDIGSAGLDHILASGRDVNVLVMDTEVYSNTGGQMSKSTPLGAVAKFAAAGKTVAKKDIALQGISYGNVYVARIAMGANPQQTLLAMREAEAYPGPSLILAYSHCIAHGINMQNGLKQQALATATGYWPLVRYNPALRQADKNPFVLDSPRPRRAFKDYAYNELRYKMLQRTNPDDADRMLELAQQLVNQKWDIYEQMATRKGSQFHPDATFSE
ncbi:MAG: pyruvate:ferredoxin (flavodoxin) oxidoreductase [Methylicorpusculum sp.]|uniref:pyruvate:ferredoxin (flavodoxin) oxidoreductase n=1 Tax=Methylicorpusculum sp. TaxID=2713644 RepID=UPI002716DFF0|nr:pyruvate:ferredoxin (flavodoxin) oxidoreductase [Methylicorpusculum sp.]MDO8939804.1 pyruvate:ferredoxin (flavodoxin) oxidoreductase [Methylicorpusculum sp.]MDP2179374.1 pyruvate:ferredoxin (flavodoxin) oxidoreductase [Methylicorpusculum sp.]MDP2202454.1 pyruvate:ferredoxin (flavodoxin) oxidoreductase [Methylicorpusculum sp.]MDP3529581.1 pyruvate:ferredoxin (flavodoxin) oxidoreductase [Methylicorpusculum sp.]MDZ4152795.1 pyruvate:ferredoxin (flavodoxin) oxidoreductase [Methylicorpusculum sp